MVKFLSPIIFTLALMPGFAMAKNSEVFDCAKTLSQRESAAEKICGVIRIVGPSGPVTGFGPMYHNAEERAAELSRAQGQCVSGFYAFAEEGLGC
jgi:hypothetical protein